MDSSDVNIIDPTESTDETIETKDDDQKLATDLDQKLNVNQEDNDPVIQDESEDKGFGVSTCMKVGSVESTPDDGFVFSTGDTTNEEEKITAMRPKTSSSMSTSTPSLAKESTKPSSKYFDNIDTMEMTRQMTELQTQDPEEFKALMMVGNEIIKFAEDNDVASIHTRILSTKNTNFLFWHTSKAFKKALDCFNKEVIEYILESLEVDLSHEVFKYIMHYFITRCINIAKDSSQQFYAAEILEMLIKHRKGKVSIDEMDPTHGNITPLQMTCKYGLYELSKKILDLSKSQLLSIKFIFNIDEADVNAVDNNDKTPLGLAKLRTMKAQLAEDENMVANMKELIASLEDRGAVIDWRKANR